MARSVWAGLAAYVTLAVLVGFAGTAATGIPEKINYQGRLTNSATGLPLIGSHSLTFRIFDAASGGTLLWSETKTETADSAGVFATVLGSVNPVSIALGASCWLEVAVDGETLSPRREMVSVPYAFRAEAANHASAADSLGGHLSAEFVVKGEPSSVTADMIVAGAGSGLDADKVDGKHANAFADTAHNHDGRYYTETELGTPGTINQAGNPVDWTKLKGVPAGFADGVDDIGAGDGYSLDGVGGTPVDAVYVTSAGDVGIGTTAPERKVHIKGIGARVLIDGETANPEVNFKNSGDSPGQVWALYKHTPTGDLRFYQGGDRITFENGTGYVGIGTDEPLEELHVLGTGPTYLYAEAPPGYASGVTMGVGGSPKWTMLYHPGDKELAFFQNGVGNRVTFTDSGRVGIGTEPTSGVLEAIALSPATAVYGGCGVTNPSTGGGIGVEGYFTSDGVSGTGVYGEANVGMPSFSYANGVVGKTNAANGHGVLSIGGLGLTGAVTSVVETADHGWRELYGLASTENWFEDFGQARLESGSATVDIDAVFADAADLTAPYHVFLTPMGDCGLYVAEKTPKSFTVKALGGQPANIDFDYRIVGKRRGYEDKRLMSAENTAAFIRRLNEHQAPTVK
ncbi:MAG TPA: hypothetical protein VMU02_07095 [bacterium]|nr:hypothetical protein [bacterium]